MKRAEVLKMCTKPKLLIYGTQDEFTPIGVAEKLFNKVPEPKMVVKVDCDHDYRYYPKIVQEINEKIGDFIIRYFN